MKIEVEVKISDIIDNADISDMQEVVDAISFRNDVSGVLDSLFEELDYDSKKELLETKLSDITDEDIQDILKTQGIKSIDVTQVEDVLSSMRDLESAAKEAVKRLQAMRR